MSEAEIGQVYKGKVTGITKFGAFVQMENGVSGMVHISEVSQSYVNDINEFLKQGQEVTVKVIAIDEKGRVNLSIKKALPPAPAPVQSAPRNNNMKKPASEPVSQENLSFEDKLKLFMHTSESKISDLNRSADRRGGRGRRR